MSSISFAPPVTENIQMSTHNAPRLSREDASTASASSRPAQAKPQKKNVLSFLTLKEPSASALEEFAAQQKKVGKSKPSSQRLPPHVPAVNSRWDGLPENQSSRQRPTSSASRESRPSNHRRMPSVPALEPDKGVSPPPSRGLSPPTPPCEALARTHLHDPHNRSKEEHQACISTGHFRSITMGNV